ncbi:MAG: hypothetical protein K2X66_12600, partial [Cyanobacteria bacterium]|nr:hypothetical protein [Cyanobacteriota bacterium]
MISTRLYNPTPSMNRLDSGSIRFGKAYTLENASQDEASKYMHKLMDEQPICGASSFSTIETNQNGRGKFMIATDEAGIPHHAVLDHLSFRTEKLPARETSGADIRHADISKLFLDLPEADLNNLVCTLAEAIPTVKRELASDQKALLRWGKITTIDPYNQMTVPPMSQLETIFEKMAEGPRTTLCRKIRDWSQYQTKEKQNPPVM